MGKLTTAPFDPSRYIGTVCHVRPVTVDVNLPRASSQSGSNHAGYTVPGGQVGEFVVIEGEEHAVLGRIVEVRLPERERLSVEPTAESESEANPVGVVQLLSAIDLRSGEALKGIPTHPRIGQHIFSAHPLLIKHVIETDSTGDDRKVQLAVFPHAQNTFVSVRPSHLFGRHAAILGATGGGKSWTVARIVEEIARLGGKAILFDATGEFSAQEDSVSHVYLGGAPEGPQDTRRFVAFPFNFLAESDLFVMFRPSGASQAPKLREAIRSLKVAHLAPALSTNGLVTKANSSKTPFERALLQHAAALKAEGAEFDISCLPKQIAEECVWPTGRAVAGGWGDTNLNDLGYCTSLIARIEADIQSPFMACVFQPAGLTPLPTVIDEFLAAPEQRILRVSLEHLPFEHNTRELVTNAVGRYLLRLARVGTFKQQPVVVILDEAHQFLNKSLGDEYSRVQLESFGLIAKEGRKYFLTCVLATQRPRDIPEDVLSQMGMFVVHRLINERDRQVVEKACGSLDASAAAFLPTLAQGEALLVGVDSPMPLPVLIRRPRFEPLSHGPNYDELWPAPIA